VVKSPLTISIIIPDGYFSISFPFFCASEIQFCLMESITGIVNTCKNPKYVELNGLLGKSKPDTLRVDIPLIFRTSYEIWRILSFLPLDFHPSGRQLPEAPEAGLGVGGGAKESERLGTGEATVNIRN
jgi:hypothetical protein